MYKRDLITSEIQKLSELLARSMGMKKTGNPAEIEEAMLQALEEKFGLTAAMLEEDEAFDLESYLSNYSFTAEELNTLGDFLFEYYNMENTSLAKRNIGKFLSALYKRLPAPPYNYLNLKNLDREALLKKAFENEH